MKLATKRNLASLAEVQAKIAEVASQLKQLQSKEEALIARVQPSLEEARVQQEDFAIGDQQYEVRFGVVYRKTLDQKKAKILLEKSGTKIPLRDSSYYQLKVATL